MRIRKRGQKSVACADCGETRIVRADSAATLCRSCNSRKAARPGLARPGRILGQNVQCKHCGETYYQHKSESQRQFCSVDCANESRRVHPIEVRKCEECQKEFNWSSKPHSNNAGRFCSLMCRNASYKKTYRGRKVQTARKAYRGWKSIRNNFVKNGNDFCCLCGKRDGRLCVHHIEPHRIRKNNNLDNLVTLCQRCHSSMEPLSDKIESAKDADRPMLVAIVQAQLHDWWHIHNGRRIQLQEAHG